MRVRLIPTGIFFAVACVCVLAVAAPALAGTRLIPSGATTQIRGGSTGIAAPTQPELRPSDRAEEGGSVADRPRPGEKKGKGIFPKKPLKAPKVKSSAVAGSGPELNISMLGLNHFDQRTANGGNQWSLEPPDQALCVGNGFTVEAVNSVLRVFDSGGHALTGVQDLNTFFGYAAAVDRDTFTIGPDVIDPVCLYDPENQRFVVAITTLHVDSDGDYTGKNTIDVAVSNTGDPTGKWTVYYVPAQNDGTDGTPDHGCKEELEDGSLVHGPCFQDYPHIGADANGVYISTNEYDFAGPNYNAAQVFAFSKKQLALHGAISVTLVENLRLEGTPGFTVWPAISNAGDYAADAGGTEYFLSTVAGDGSETGNPTGTAKKIGLWALTNTASLDGATPDLAISSTAIGSQDYVYPPLADQKPGSIPLGDCLNDTSDLLGSDPDLGDFGCWYIFLDPPTDWQPESESSPDSGDTRMQQVWYANGLLWGANGTAADVGKDIKAGIAWYAVEPKIDSKDKGKGKGKDEIKLDGKVKKQGYLALENNNLTYPAIAMGANGKGVIAFSVMGKDYFPSAGYALIDSKGNVGPVQIAAAGVGPTDGFTSYKGFVGDPPRTRWGDYGAAVTDGNSIWIASEYIDQTCTFDEYLYDDLFGPTWLTCGGTRTSLANWATRVSKITP
jgi:hypothetical protein